MRQLSKRDQHDTEIINYRSPYGLQQAAINTRHNTVEIYLIIVYICNNILQPISLSV